MLVNATTSDLRVTSDVGSFLISGFLYRLETYRYARFREIIDYYLIHFLQLKAIYLNLWEVNYFFLITSDLRVTSDVV